MNNITKFKLSSSFESNLGGGTLAYPNTSYIEDTTTLHLLSSNSSKKNYMYVEALEDGLSIQFNQLMNASANSLEYSTDQKVWKTTSNGVPTDTINAGEKLYFRGDVTTMDTTFDIDNNMFGIGTFVFDKKCNVGGNIMSLLFNDNFEDKYDLSEYVGVFIGLFGNTHQIGMLINADKLIMPAKILSPYCYVNMFAICTSLVTAPELPATKMTFNCYDSMFYGCTSLTTAPELPATTLVDYCYYRMFGNCTSLVTTPKLPATTLAYGCYEGMFSGCTNLTISPELPATKMTFNCYDSMFYGCTSLTTAPELPATTLEYGCYHYMFFGCTSLITAPELPAATLVKNCYQYMFMNCTSLNNITMLATDISASTCLHMWTNNVASTGTFTKHPDMTTLPSGNSGIPNGWTVVDYVS